MPATPTLHQLIPVLHAGDAASNHALALQRLLRELGFTSTIYADRTDTGLEHAARPTAEFGGGPAIYQFAVGSTQAQRLLAAEDPFTLVSHNVTPAHFFFGWDPALAHACVWGEQQLGDLARAASIGVGVSQFNTGQLVELGCRRAVTAPIIIDLDERVGTVDPQALDRLTAARRGTQWLFVGRVVQNKAHHDVLKAFAVYRCRHDPHAHLWFVGTGSSSSYETALRRFVTACDLDDAVTFTGRVSPAVLAAHYRAADVFVCLSDHEGFCVPLLEAMHHRLPVVAYGAAAVPETLATAGVCLPEKTPEIVACSVARVMGDDELRTRLIAAGLARLGAFSASRVRARWRDVLVPWHTEVAP